MIQLSDTAYVYTAYKFMYNYAASFCYSTVKKLEMQMENWLNFVEVVTPCSGVAVGTQS